jgi:predicted RecB family nuclease
MRITPDVFEAYLKCPTKSWLRATGESSTGNNYAEWLKGQNDAFRTIVVNKLVAGSGSHRFLPIARDFETPMRRLATSVAVELQSDSFMLHSELHAVEYLPSKHNLRSSEVVPIRFIRANKVGRDDMLLLGFDAFLLTQTIGQEIAVGKIIHGDHGATLKVKTSTFVRDAQQRIKQIAELLSASSPPELILKRHCAECEFQRRCRQNALDTDDLSLLSGMSKVERAQHRSRGIFSVRQLSYTFRPRRTRKRAKNRTRPHSFALQALAIRENTIYIHGTPHLPECKNHVYLDIEGLPDRDFYYLIGALIVSEEGETSLSFWADTKSDEGVIFERLAEVMAKLPDFRVFHFGAYDVSAIKRVSAGLREETRQQYEAILQRSINVLSLIHSHVYFPTHSNNLKGLARYLTPDVPQAEATGLDSIIWRMKWEAEQDASIKQKLIDYNRADCKLVVVLVHFIYRTTSAGLGDGDGNIAIERTDDLALTRPHWQLFAPKPFALTDLEHVNKSAYFDYQREKVFVRTHSQFKAKGNRYRTRAATPKPSRTHLIESETCPYCQGRKLERYAESSHDVTDLDFSHRGVRRYITRFVSWRYRCGTCSKTFRSEDRLPHPQKYGHSLASWCVYQNNVLGVNMSKVQKGIKSVFHLELPIDAIERSRDRIALFYEPLYAEILEGIIASPLMHIDETTVRMRKAQGYVWVLTTMDKVYYFYRPSRETGFLREMLASFRGVLVSDFYTGYDSLPCEQQKCLVHFIRDIDDDLLRNPLDSDLSSLAMPFGRLLRTIVATIDRYGLKHRHLNKHKKEVRRFLADVETASFGSELANRYKSRFKKHGPKMFTFLDHDDVPWNNTNAEHAIKRFAKYRRENEGRYTEDTVKTYLVLASVFETCEYNNLDVLQFLLSRVRTLAGQFQMDRWKRKASISAATGMKRSR